MSRQILVVDSVCTNRILSGGALAGGRFELRNCGTAAAARAALAEGRPDVILLGVGAGQPGLAFCRELRARPETRDIPVIGIGSVSDAKERLALLKAGTDEVLMRPLDPAMLLARIRCLLRGRDELADLRPREELRSALGFADETEPFFPGNWSATPGENAVCLFGSATLVTGRSGEACGALARLAFCLDGSVQPVDVEGDGACGLSLSVLRDEAEMAFQAPADLVILDAAGGATGLEQSIAAAAAGRCLTSGALFRLIADIRAHPDSRHSAILAIVPPGAVDLAVMALDLGASDLVTSEVGGAELAFRIDGLLRRKRSHDSLRDNLRDELQAAVTDPLTGLHNRRYAMPALNRLAGRAQDGASAGSLRRSDGRAPDPARGVLAVMILDVDHFKRINDRFGHATGDRVLAEIASRLRGELAENDLVARIGGEEFLVVLPGSSEVAAIQRAENLCTAIRTCGFEVPAGGLSEISRRIEVTISVGLALAEAEETGDQLLLRADAALYIAKAQGRDRVAYDQPQSPSRQHISPSDRSWRGRPAARLT